MDHTNYDFRLDWMKKYPQKKLKKFFITALAAQMAQTENLIFLNVAYRPIVNRTGPKIILWNTPGISQFSNDFKMTHNPKFIFSECACSVQGSVNSSCDANGQCTCKDTFTGDKCEDCAAEHYNIANSCHRKLHIFLFWSCSGDPTTNSEIMNTLFSQFFQPKTDCFYGANITNKQARLVIDQKEIV